MKKEKYIYKVSFLDKKKKKKLFVEFHHPSDDGHQQEIKKFFIGYDIIKIERK